MEYSCFFNFIRFVRHNYVVSSDFYSILYCSVFLIIHIRTKNDEAKQRKIATEYVALCGFKHGEIGGGHQSSDNHKSGLTQAEIASQLGISVPTLNEMLAIERKLTPEIKEMLDTIFKQVLNNVK